MFLEEIVTRESHSTGRLHWSEKLELDDIRQSQSSGIHFDMTIWRINWQTEKNIKVISNVSFHDRRVGRMPNDYHHETVYNHERKDGRERDGIEALTTIFYSYTQFFTPRYHEELGVFS